MASRARSLLADGLNPKEAKRPSGGATFGECADRLIEAMRPGWRNAIVPTLRPMRQVRRQAGRRTAKLERAAQPTRLRSRRAAAVIRALGSRSVCAPVHDLELICFRFQRLLLQKSFCTGGRKFCGLPVRLSCKDAGGLIPSRETHRRLRQYE
jgi:hypothetical protein